MAAVPDSASEQHCMPINAQGQSATCGLTDPLTGIHVTLSALDSSDQRELELVTGDTLVLGRASKSDTKGLMAKANNAYFDCPVVSRQHAQIKLRDSRVFITDTNSLHGTAVNGMRLIPRQICRLKTGDVIKLGDRVLRGDDQHDGLSLKFSILPEARVKADKLSLERFRGYHAPSSNDSEWSSDSESDIEEGHASSSAHTTPEQSKPKLGSWDQPITIDALDEKEGGRSSDAQEVGITTVTFTHDVEDDVQYVAESIFTHQAQDPAAEEQAIEVEADLSQDLSDSDAGSEADGLEPDTGYQYHEYGDLVVETNASDDISEVDNSPCSITAVQPECDTFKLARDEHDQQQMPSTEGSSGRKDWSQTSAPKVRYDPVRGSQPPVTNDQVDHESVPKPINTSYFIQPSFMWSPLAEKSNFGLKFPGDMMMKPMSTFDSTLYPPADEISSTAVHLEHPAESFNKFACGCDQDGPSRCAYTGIQSTGPSEFAPVDTTDRAASKKRKADESMDATTPTAKMPKVPGWETARLDRADVHDRASNDQDAETSKSEEDVTSDVGKRTQSSASKGQTSMLKVAASSG